MIRIRAGDLQSVAVDLLQAWGVPAAASRIVAGHLVDSSLAGVDSHGIMRLPQYLDLIAGHEVDVTAQVETLSDRGSVVALEGNCVLGPVAGEAAATLAARRATEHGIALVFLRHAGHAGRIGAYTELMARHDVVGLAFCNSPVYGHYVAPPGAREGRLATNPISYAVPAPGAPVVADFATSTMPEGAVRLLRDRGQSAPPDVLLDAWGSPTTDPNALYGKPRGALLPLGGVRSGRKGFSLGLLVEVLAGTLVGDAVRDDALRGNNLTFIGIDVRATPAAEVYPRLIDELVAYVHSAAPIDPDTPVLVPGEKERNMRATRSATGIPIDEFTWRQIAERAARVGCTLPAVEYVE